MKLIEILEEIKFSPEKENAKAWIQKMYQEFPNTFQNNHLIILGKEQYVAFELVPSFTKKGAVEIKWIQAIPTQSGLGQQGIKILQDKAREDGISLTLFPWDKGVVGQSKLTKFYKKHGFKSSRPGSKNMEWTPDIKETDEDDMKIYRDHFDRADNAFSVMLYNKVWKSFPTHNEAKAAADNCNKKKGRIVAHVVEN